MLPTMDSQPTAEMRDVSDGSVEETKGMKRKMSLSNCGVCGSEEAKYRCPACLKQSCSLLCVKKHKEDSGCSGVRDKVAFVALSQFDEMNLLNDYRFLEDTGRMTDAATRDTLIRKPCFNFKSKGLSTAVRKMNITLRFLPTTFTKSRENSTVFSKKLNQVLWHLKLVFPQSNTEFSERRVLDDQTLEQILTRYIHPTESDPVRRQKLKMYVHEPFDHVKVFMKAEGRRANSVRYHELDLGKSLRDNLSRKTLIEYPVLHVVLRDNFSDYPLKGAVEPASAHTTLTTESKGAAPGSREVTQIPPRQQEPCTPAASSSVVQEICPELDPPMPKRAKRDAGEMEDGEIPDSDDEGKEEVVDCTKDDSLVKSAVVYGNDTRHADLVSDTKGAKYELADDDASSDGTHDDKGSSECVNEHIDAPAGDNGAVIKSAEVSKAPALSGGGDVEKRVVCGPVSSYQSSSSQ